MSVSKLKIIFILFVFTLFSFNLLSRAQEKYIMNPQVIPNNIKVGTFFNGIPIKIKAELPEYSQAVVKLLGKETDLSLNMKGKKAFVWLNVAKVIVKNTPSIYILTSSERLNELCSNLEKNKEQLGYDWLKEKIIFESTIPLNGKEFNEFIKLKEDKGYYNVNDNAVIRPASNGKHFLDATIDIPSFISPGEYNVVIYCFKEGKLLEKSIVKLNVEKVGMPLLITNLAKGSPAFYGTLAIIVAMIAGLTIGVIFIKKKNREN